MRSPLHVPKSMTKKGPHFTHWWRMISICLFFICTYAIHIHCVNIMEFRFDLQSLLPIMGMNVQMNKLWCANEEFEPCKCKRAPNDWIQAVNTLTLQMQNHCNKLITTKTPSMTKPQPIKHHPNVPNYKNSFNICFSQHFYCLWFINVSWHTLRTFSVLLSSFQAPHSVVCNQCDIIDFIYIRVGNCVFFVRFFFAPLGS